MRIKVFITEHFVSPERFSEPARRRCTLLVVASSLVVVWSCGGDSTSGVVAPPPTPVAASIKIFGSVDSVSQLEPLHLAVHALTASGDVIANPTVNWSSLNERVATVAKSGVVLGAKPGTAQIVAQMNGVADTVRIAVRMKWLSVSLGVISRTACGVGGDSTAYCWGDTALTHAADGSIPTELSSTLRFASLTNAGGGVCGVTAGGAVYCMGVNTSGELGIGNTSAVSGLVRANLDFAATQVVKGFLAACALSSSGDVYCWGSNAYGQGGRIPASPTEVVMTPTKIAGLPAIASISMSGAHGCAISKTFAAYCWGMNIWATIGDGTLGNVRGPTLVGGGLSFKTISAGWDATCGVTVSSGIYCWGDRNAEQFPSVVSPQPMPQTNAATGVSVGDFHRCYSVPDGAWCWGSNFYGQLGAPSREFVASPVAVTGPNHFVSISAGEESTCAITPIGELYCWGANVVGEVGDGTRIARPIPTRVVNPP